MKSPPELWQQLDQPKRLQGWMCALVGHATDIVVTESRAEQVLSWRAAGANPPARIELKMERKGWGTHLEINAEGGTTALEGWGEAVLDELAASEKRPFEGIV